MLCLPTFTFSTVSVCVCVCLYTSTPGSAVQTEACIHPELLTLFSLLVSPAPQGKAWAFPGLKIWTFQQILIQPRDHSLDNKTWDKSSGFQEDSVQRPILPLDLDPFITERPERRRKRRRIVQSRSSYTYTHQVWELLVFAQHTTAWCTVSTAYTSLQTLSYILNATIYFLLTWRNSHIFYKTDI